MLGEQNQQKNNISPNPDTSMRAVKTYKDFAVSSLQGSSTSLAQMIIKEKKKQELKESYTLKNKKNVTMLVLSILLVILGVSVVIGIIFFSITKNKELNDKASTIFPESIVPYDYKTEIDITDMSRIKFVSKFKKTIQETVIPIGDVKIITLVKRNSEGYKKLATARDFIKKLDTRIPVQLERSLYKSFTTGILSSDNAVPFLIFKVNSFDTAYVNMMSWEKTLLYDIGDIFNISRTYFSRKFEDLSLYNADTRVILNGEGNVVFGYSFIDMTTLVFFTTSDTFSYLKSTIQSYQERK